MDGSTTGLPGGSLAFAKLCGAGNDFIVLDGEAARSAPGAETIRLLCDRRYGVGADGLMLLRRGSGAGAGGDDAAFEVDFYNADGSGGMLCGNGARCALERARILGWIEPDRAVGFRFAGRDYRGSSLGEGMARFELDPRVRMDAPRLVRVGDLSLSGRFVDVGSPHFVVDVAAILGGDGRRAFGSLDDVPLDALGQAVRNHPDFGAAGVNANVTELLGATLFVRTFERGVEAETLSCGTGSASSALVRWRDGELRPPVTVVARSGDELAVDFEAASDGSLTRLSLSGPAIQTFEGRVVALPLYGQAVY